MRRWCTTVAIVAALFAGRASAVPIVYQGQILPNQITSGTITQPNANPSNPVGAVYYYFYANAGATVDLFGDRQDGGYDMSFWVMSGLYADTDDFGGSLPGSAAFSVFGDDQDSPNLPGPFGDPHVNFVAPFSGYYTVAVTNYLSAGSPPFDFTLQGSGIAPEPATLAVFGLMGIAGAGYALRRRKVAV